MAISYPLSPPALTNVVSVDITHVDATSIARSPFTGQTQAFPWPAARRQAVVRLGSMAHSDAVAWVAFLTSLRGRLGTFLMGDPLRQSLQGTATSVAITGSAGDRTVTVAADGTLKAGDMFSLGTGADVRLHEVLTDGGPTGTLEIWPALRANHAATVAALASPKGVWRMMSDETGWSISAARRYGISFAAEEVV